MTQVQQPPAVDVAGNITIHGRSGLTLPLTFEDADGNPRDVTGASLFFEVAGVLRIELEPGSTLDERILQFGDEHAALIFGPSARLFVFRDESGAEPDVFWSGTIRAIGFKDQPA